ncbi:restriction endonuclease subunit S [Sphingomonas rubra]|uniref:Restriction endonuclease S subunit n=1 Tax=Sphingomonas rubra TaxID=634430 RepID=A0A1I5R1B5_9SPHN|nr:restriction endonuclease subunit S [Sphingomonas rubra]SFP51846.1 Restriction endonuclease S subunit [Sphingomonas rubra]
MIPLLEVCRAYQPQTIGRKDMDNDGAFPVYGANGVIGRYHSYNHEESEVLLGCRGSCGSVNVSEPQSWITGNAMVIKPRDHRLSKEFLRYFLDGSDAIAKTITGVAQPQITQKSLATVAIPLPPLEEQHRIVAVLDEAFAAIAIASANAQQNLANARELFDAAFRESFDHTDDGWAIYRLTDISENWDYLRRPVTKSDRIAGDIPYYGASGQVDSVRDHLFDDDLLLVSEDGANLLMRTYPIAFSITGKAWVNNHAHILNFDDMATQRLVEFYINSISVAPWVSGMAQPKLNQKALNQIPVPLPPMDQRERLVAELDELAEQIGKWEANRQTRLEALAALKQSLLHRAFSGELTSKAKTAAALDSDFATPAFAAKVVAFAYERHVAKNRVRNFGTVKAEKILHMVEAIGSVDLGRQPSREAAGPDDATHRHATWDWARSQHFFRFNKRSGGGHDFEKLSAYSGMIKEARTAIAGSAVEKAIELLVDMDRDFAELIATTYAAWNNLIIDRCAATDDDIVLAARDRWHRDKLRFDPSRFHDAIRFIRNNNIVPDGTAKRVGGQEALLL